LIRFFLVFLVFISSLFGDILKENFITFDLNSSSPTVLVDFESDNLAKFIKLDADGSGIITWSELRAKRNEIEKLVLRHIEVFSDEKSCKLTPKSFEVYRRVHQSYIRYYLNLGCKLPKNSLRVKYDLFFDVDKNQKAFVKKSTVSQKPVILSPRVRETTFKIKKEKSKFELFKEFLVDGIWHIWMGYDHILFLLMLLIPSIYAKGLIPIDNFSKVLVNILKIVTAFSIAHSITLALSVTELVKINPNFIEVAIALSILFTAVNNIFFFLKGEIWVVAFLFGLIHGFGFANVLNDMIDKKSSFATLLVGFNLGVEVGQIAIVLSLLPIFYFLRKTSFYKKYILKGFSIVTIFVSSYWAIDRAFG